MPAVGGSRASPAGITVGRDDPRPSQRRSVHLGQRSGYDHFCLFVSGSWRVCDDLDLYRGISSVRAKNDGCEVGPDQWNLRDAHDLGRDREPLPQRSRSAASGPADEFHLHTPKHVARHSLGIPALAPSYTLEGRSGNRDSLPWASVLSLGSAIETLRPAP